MRRLYADALRAEVLRIREQLAGEDVVLDDALVAVEVRDEQVERADALDQAFADAIPLIARDDAGDDVEWPRAVDRAAFLVVDRERDAHDEDREFGSVLALAQLVVRQRAQVAAQRARGHPRAAARSDELVPH